MAHWRRGVLRAAIVCTHGFDAFFGNLYHLNAEEEPEHYDYPKDPSFHKRFRPRGKIEPEKLDDSAAPSCDPEYDWAKDGNVWPPTRFQPMPLPSRSRRCNIARPIRYGLGHTRGRVSEIRVRR